MDQERTVSPDAELCRLTRLSPEGDVRAIERLVRLHEARVVANCRCLTGDRESAEGEQGTLRAVTAAHTILEDGDRSITIANAIFLDRTAKQ